MEGSAALIVGQPARAGARRGRLLLRAMLVAVLCWPCAAWLAARWLIVGAAGSEHAEAVAVLSGSAAYVERTREAARLFREGRAGRVLLTDDGERGGWSQREQRNPFFVERAESELLGAGVPAAKIERVPGAFAGTREEALRLREFAEAKGLRSMLFVTSPYHTRRAWWTLGRVFEGSGVRLGLVAANAVESPPPSRWWLARAGWRSVAGEYLKLAYYRARF